MNQYAGLDLRPFARAGRGGDNAMVVSRGGQPLMHINDKEMGLISLMADKAGGLSRNPYTGLPEAFKLKDLISFAAPIALNMAIPALSNYAGGEGVMGALGDAAKWMGTNEWGPAATGLLSGAVTGLATGDVMKGVGSGLMGYGIQSLAGPKLMDMWGPKATESVSLPDYDPISGQTIEGPSTMERQTGPANQIEYNKSSKYALPMTVGGAMLALLSGMKPNSQNKNAPTGPEGSKYQWNYSSTPWDRSVHGFPGDISRYGRDGGEWLFAPNKKMAGGGIVSLMGGGLTMGPGSGTDDMIPASIGGVQPAALSPGEFVVPADAVSGLGNGSTNAGAKELQGMVNRIRQLRTGMSRQPRDVNPKRVMPR